MKILISTAAVIALIWLSPLLLSDATGLRLGVPYRVFFTLFSLFSGWFFFLLRRPAMPPPESTGRALGMALTVFVATVGAMVLLAAVAPQFASETTSSAAATASEKGEAVFNSPNAGCFLCHVVDGAGGTRGPDLSRIGSVASERRPGMSAEDYLRESLLNPGAYVVPPYENIMPSSAQRLSSEELDDLIEYLGTLR